MCQSFVQELKNYPTYKQYELDAKYNGNRNIVLQSAAQIFGVSEWEGGGGGGITYTLTSWIQGHRDTAFLTALKKVFCNFLLCCLYS